MGSSKNPPRPNRREQLIRQIGHRAAIMATLVLVAAGGAILMRKGIYWRLLLVSFLTADLTLLCGVITSWQQRGRSRRDREPLGLVIYGAILLIPTLALVIMAKRELLDGLITALTGK